ncbi:MAG: YqiA/YcfP family alpha/beta fold hydrolase [Gammaproteobacteria bacterium]
MLIYIHGFNSSPESFKASLLRKYVASMGLGDTFLVPELSSIPSLAILQLENLVQENTLKAEAMNSSVCLIGSSLGGYYATWLAEKYGCRAVLVNPAVRPFELFEDFLGVNRNIHTGEEYELTTDHLQQLGALNVNHITHPDRYLLMLQTGDDILDYKIAIEKYAAVPSIVEEGGGHEFMGFDRHLETVLAFCGVNCLKSYS